MRLCLACARSVGVADVNNNKKDTNGDCETTNRRNAYPALNVRPASHSPTNFVLSSPMARGVLRVGLMTTVAWTAFLGYGLFRLVF